MSDSDQSSETVHNSRNGSTYDSRLARSIHRLTLFVRKYPQAGTVIGAFITASAWLAQIYTLVFVFVAAPIYTLSVMFGDVGVGFRTALAAAVLVHLFFTFWLLFTYRYGG